MEEPAARVNLELLGPSATLLPEVLLPHLVPVVRRLLLLRGRMGQRRAIVSLPLTGFDVSIKIPEQKCSSP
jgi:hypothetical protein